MALVQPQTTVMGRRGVLSSDSLPDHLSDTERFNIFFHESRPAFADACDMVQAEGRKTSANFEFACFRDVACLRFRASVSRRLRSALHLAADQRDAYHLVFNTNDVPLVSSQRGREAVQETGQVRLMSMAEPLDVRSRTDMAAICLNLSGARLREHGVNPDDLVLSTLDPANAALCHLRRYMMGLFEGGEFEGDPVLSARIETTLIDLAVLALDGEGDSTALARNGRGLLPRVETLPGVEPQGVRYRFAGFELEPCERRLLARGQPVTLTPKVFDTLVLLVERAGRVVSRDELMKALWPRGFVTDANLAKHIWAIRKALGGGCEGDSRFIETVSKAGYRFVAPVERIEPREAVTADAGGASSALAVAPSPATDDGNPATQSLAATPDVSNDAPVEQRAFGRRASDRELAAAVAGAARPRRHGWGVAIAAIAVLAIGGVAGGLMWRRAQPSRGRLPPMAPGTAVAIVAFNNLSQNPKDAWLGPALTEMLATEVTATGRMHVLPAELVRPVRKDLPALVAGGYAPASLATLHKRLGADYVLSGGYLVSGTGTDAKLRVDLVLQDARNDASVAEFSQLQSTSGLLKLVANAGATLRTRLGLPAMAPDSVRELAGEQPPSPDVARHIGFALDAMNAYDPARARDELLLAVAEAPGYAPARMLLARAWLMLGQHDKALAEVQWATAHMQGLPQSQRSLITARKFEAQHHWSDAAEVYRQLVERRPDDLDYRLDRVEDLWKAGLLDQAGRALDQARKLPLSLAAEPRIELAAWHIAYSRGDIAGEIAGARKALRAARAVGAADMVADSEYFLGQTYGRAGKPDASRQLLLAAYDYYRRSGDVEGQASAQRRLGWLAERQHDGPTAQEAYQRALAIYQSIGNLFWQSQTYIGLSKLQLKLGDSDVALASARQAAVLARETGEVDQQAFAMAWLASLELQNGAGDQVLAELSESIRMQKQSWDKTRLPWTLARYSEALLARGRLDAAQDACEQARTIAKAAGASQQEFALLACMDVEVARGHATAANADADRLLSIARNTGDHAMRNTTLLHEARIAINDAKWTVARDRLHDLSVVQGRDLEMEVRAKAWLAVVANALGDTKTRDHAVARARTLRAKINMHSDAFIVDLALARLQGETGERDTAVAKLRALAADADKRDWVASALEARLASYRLLEQANAQAADTLHDKIETTAKADGFKWVLARLNPPAASTSVALRN